MWLEWYILAPWSNGSLYISAGYTRTYRHMYVQYSTVQYYILHYYLSEGYIAAGFAGN